MRHHLGWPHSHPVVLGAGSVHSNPPNLDRPRGQVLRDKLIVLAVFLLVLATATVFIFYVLHEAPRWQAGQVGGFQATAPLALQESTLSDDALTAASDSNQDLGQTQLVLISTLVEMVIFVGLGLYLRYDMNRKP